MVERGIRAGVDKPDGDLRRNPLAKGARQTIGELSAPASEIAPDPVVILRPEGHGTQAARQTTCRPAARVHRVASLSSQMLHSLLNCALRRGPGPPGVVSGSFDCATARSAWPPTQRGLPAWQRRAAGVCRRAITPAASQVAASPAPAALPGWGRPTRGARLASSGHALRQDADGQGCRTNRRPFDGAHARRLPRYGHGSQIIRAQHKAADCRGGTVCPCLQHPWHLRSPR